MSISKEYYLQKYREAYAAAMSAKASGDLSSAKQKFGECADFLERLASLGGENAGEQLAFAARMRAVADAIVPTPYPTDAVPVASAGSLYPVGGETAVPAGMEQYFTFLPADRLEGFESVIGLEAAKEAVRDYVIDPARYPEAYHYNFLDNKAILLEGPPGTGKTTFAKAVARELDRPFALINVSALVNCLIGETGKNIDKVFAFLRNFAEEKGCGVTVFIDELDEIAKRRGSDDKTSEAAVPALLRNLDGVASNRNFLILANTNRKELLDPAVAERFRKLIYIPLPDKATREKLFAAKLADVEQAYKKELDLPAAAALAEGLSGRDITFICDDFKYILSKMAARGTSVPLFEELCRLIEERAASKA